MRQNLSLAELVAETIAAPWGLGFARALCGVTVQTALLRKFG